jgi:hypothetical protein
MAFMTIVEPSLMVRTNIRETNPKDQEKDSWEVLAMKIRGRGQLKCDALGICSLLNHKIRPQKPTKIHCKTSDVFQVTWDWSPFSH